MFANSRMPSVNGWMMKNRSNSTGMRMMYIGQGTPRGHMFDI